MKAWPLPWSVSIEVKVRDEEEVEIGKVRVRSIAGFLVCAENGGLGLLELCNPNKLVFVDFQVNKNKKKLKKSDDEYNKLLHWNFITSDGLQKIIALIIIKNKLKEKVWKSNVFLFNSGK